LHILTDKSEIFGNIIALVWYGSKTSHTETRTQPKVLENRVVREYMENRKQKKKEKLGEFSVMRNVTICLCLHIHFNVHIKEDKMGVQISCMGENRNTTYIEGLDGNA
jgi:predicted TIM-barrel fold metal-dependent hydrolase